MPETRLHMAPNESTDCDMPGDVQDRSENEPCLHSTISFLGLRRQPHFSLRKMSWLSVATLCFSFVFNAMLCPSDLQGLETRRFSTGVHLKPWSSTSSGNAQRNTSVQACNFCKIFTSHRVHGIIKHWVIVCCFCTDPLAWNPKAQWMPPSTNILQTACCLLFWTVGKGIS